jgi:hypothetical protein
MPQEQLQYAKKKAEIRNQTPEGWKFSCYTDLTSIWESTLNTCGLTVQIKIGTPKDGRWTVSARIEESRSGKGYVPRLTDFYEERTQARDAALQLLRHLNSQPKIDQFIQGIGSISINKNTVTTDDIVAQLSE